MDQHETNGFESDDGILTIAEIRKRISTNICKYLFEDMKNGKEILYHLSDYIIDDYSLDKNTFLKIFNYVSSKDTDDNTIMDKYSVLLGHIRNFKLFNELDDEIINIIIRQINNDLNDENGGTEYNYKLKIELVKTILKNMESFNENVTIKTYPILDDSHDENMLITVGGGEEIPVLYYRDLPLSFRVHYLEKIFSTDTIKTINSKEVSFYKKMVNDAFLNHINIIKNYDSQERQLENLSYLKEEIDNYFNSPLVRINVDSTNMDSTNMDNLIDFIKQDLENRMSTISKAENLHVTEKTSILAKLADIITFAY